MRKPEHRPRPEAKSQPSVGPNLSTTPNPDTKHAQHGGLRSPEGSPPCQGVRQQGHGKRKCLARRHQIPVQVEHRALVPRPTVTLQPTWPEAKLSCIPEQRPQRPLGPRSVHRHPGARGYSITGTIPCSAGLVLLATPWLKTYHPGPFYFVRCQF